MQIFADSTYTVLSHLSLACTDGRGFGRNEDIRGHRTARAPAFLGLKFPGFIRLKFCCAYLFVGRKTNLNEIALTAESEVSGKQHLPTSRPLSDSFQPCLKMFGGEDM